MKMVAENPGLGDHHVGVVLVHKGRLLNELNAWTELGHYNEHVLAAEEVFELPDHFEDLMSTVKEAAIDKMSQHSLPRANACVLECLAVAKGATQYVFSSLGCCVVLMSLLMFLTSLVLTS